MIKYQVLYFSRNFGHIEDFHRRAQEYEEKYSFQVGGEVLDYYKKKCATHFDNDVKLEVTDLPILLQRINCWDNLFVILDYNSFYYSINEENNKDGFSKYLDTDVLRKMILSYPEIIFLFDQSEVSSDSNLVDFISYLFDDSVVDLIISFHVFDWKNPFVQLLLDFSNLFDGSKLRLAIKEYNQSSLLRMNSNYGKIQESKKTNFAISVEDESNHNRFNCYALYACGYRVIPVQTARMLLMLNLSLNIVGEPSLIVRDLDLQFLDTREDIDYNKLVNENYEYHNVPTMTDSGFSINELPIDNSERVIDYIRDYKYDKDGNWDKSFPKGENPFWNKLRENSHVFFISNGLDKLYICNSMKECYFERDDASGQTKVSGLHKPVSGLYHPFFSYFMDRNGNKIIRDIFNNTRYWKKDSEYTIVRKRKDKGGHAIPPDIYSIVDNMLSRATYYLNNEHYIKAAVIAQESIEVLNGFYPQLTLKAYYIKTISEHAIAMDVVGLNEDDLVRDCEIRIDIIKEDITRIISSLDKDDPQRKQQDRILKHIFSGCRDRCHQFEYYKAESIFISAMAHLEEHDPNRLFLLWETKLKLHLKIKEL